MCVDRCTGVYVCVCVCVCVVCVCVYVCVCVCVCVCEDQSYMALCDRSLTTSFWSGIFLFAGFAISNDVCNYR